MSDIEKSKVKALVEKMLWQPANGHNYRWRQAQSTIIRYCEAVSMAGDQLKLLLDYLKSEEIVDGSVQLLGKSLTLDGKWKASDAWIQTQEGEKFQGTQSSKVRIYQALVKVQAEDSEPEGPYVVEGNAAYKVTHEYYYNRQELPQLPNSSDGAIYSYQGVNFDQEAGLVSYVLEKREPIELTEAIVDVRKGLRADSIAKTDKRKKTAPSEADIAALKPGESLRIDKNDDGSVDVTTGNTTPKTGVKILRELVETPTEIVETATDTVEKLEDFPTEAAEKGVTKRKTLRQNEDLSVEQTIVKTTEKAQSASSKEIRKTLRGTLTIQVDDNQPQDFTEAEIAALKTGESLRSDKTPGQNFRKTKTSLNPDGIGIIAQSCEKNAFVETDSQTEIVNEIPELPNHKGAEAPEASGDDEEGDDEPPTEPNLPTGATDLTTVQGKDSLVTVSWQKAEGGFDKRTITEKPIATDTGWITWNSETKTAGGTYKYHHGVRIFHNQKKVPKPQGSSVQINVTPNKFGLFDGSISYNDLYDWTSNGSSGGTTGGSQQGTYTYYEFRQLATGRYQRREMKVQVIYYYGQGNEGSEAATIANMVQYPGMHLPSRMYAKSAPTAGSWEDVK